MDAIMIYVTTPSHDEAVRIGSALVEGHLAGSVNIFDGARSIYRWEGRVHDAGEAILIVKSVADRLPAITARVKQLHSYECPCIVAVPIIGGNEEYLAWLRDAVGRGQQAPKG
jgi:periplasmic divalent cation tolerance protein